MSKARIIVPVILSIFLIGIALWTRFSENSGAIPGIVAIANIEKVGNTLSDEIFASDLSGASSTPLSEIDLISRQLFSDYVDLASRGENSSENLENLATKYADGILSQKQAVAQVATMDQVSVVPDSEDSLYVYHRNITLIRSKYAALVQEKHGKAGISGNINDSSFNNFIFETGKMYSSSAKELLALPVPASLAENHLAIINNYFESAEAMNSIADPSTDPVKIYSAVNTQIQNTSKETELFLNVQIALMANGIMFEQGI